MLLVPSFVVTAIFFHLSTLAQMRRWSSAEIASGFAVYALSQFAAITVMGRLVDRIGAVRPLRVHLLPLALAVLVLGGGDDRGPVWIAFAGLGLAAGSNTVLTGALWPETFGTRQVGLVRGVYAAFSVTASAVAPFLFGAALTRSIPLASIGLACGLYCLLVPPALAGYVRRG